VKVLVFGRAECDYLQDDIYHGLKSLLGTDVESNVGLNYLYKDCLENPLHMYGRGFSYYRNLDPALRNIVPPDEILDKALSNYYDAIIYLSVRRCDTHLKVLSEKMPEKIALCDGEDNTAVMDTPLKFFKRELMSNPTRTLFPISFAIPEEKIVQPPFKDKIKELGSQIPGPAHNRGYIFTSEEEYYRDYQVSKYGLTWKKWGWDCKRHYEILCNRCIPLFERIDECPPNIMVNFPKVLVSEVENNYKTVSEATYNEWLEELFAYTKEHLTTKTLASYILGK
jgi:hypothetical protein